MIMPRKGYDTVVWEIVLPATLAAEAELILLDPITAKPKHGERSKIVESLMREWVSSMKQKRS